MKRTTDAVRSWHIWSELWFSASLFTILFAFLAMLFLVSSYLDKDRSDWVEANGIYVLGIVHLLYIPLGLQVYCGHRMSKAKRAAESEAASIEREFEA